MSICRSLLFIFAAGAALAAPLANGPVKPRSLSKITFGPDGILFLADSLGARIYAVDLDDRKPADIAKPLDLGDLEGKLGALLGADPRDVLIHSMAVNPISKNAYLTVSRGRRGFQVSWQLPNDVANATALVRVTPTGDLSEVPLDQVRYSSVDISRAPDDKAAAPEWKKSTLRVDTVSDMAYANGKLYVAGLSNEEFSSTMRIYSYPFDGSSAATSIEIYHGSHGKFETDSPIRSFLPITIRGKQHLLASYLCTPLVLLPVDSLKDGQHVKGTTIGELGSGNYPLDMLAFRYQGKDRIWIVNSTRGLLMFDAAEFEKPLPAITKPVEDVAGVPFQHLRNRGILQVENYGDKHVLMLVRNVLNGEVRFETVALENQ
jgi:hypothetical protein